MRKSRSDAAAPVQVMVETPQPVPAMMIGNIIVGSNRFLRRQEVEMETGLSRSSIYKMMEDGTFPRPRRIGQRSVAWPASDIEKWKSERPTV